jgi:hypothetical protein|tara:strand:- start:114 stop:362 length:249 start_codon:yes stop_codon:yes gene_type:complete
MATRLNPLFHVAQTWATRKGETLRLVSANDHVHTSPRSKHFSDEALDFHSSDLPGLAQWLRGYGYHVLFEVPGHFAHVHAEG